ncbi:MAK10-like protein [Tanacetum coccineum]
MHDDIPTKVSKATRFPNYHVNTAELQGYILYELKAILNGFGKFVTEFGLQAPPQHLLKDLKNKLLMEDKNYKRDLLMQELLFVYGHVASSGIASMLLPAGRTTHSRFKLPLELTNESLCHTKKKSQLGNGEIGEPDEEENKTALGLQFHLNIIYSNWQRDKRDRDASTTGTYLNTILVLGFRHTELSLKSRITNYAKCKPVGRFMQRHKNDSNDDSHIEEPEVGENARTGESEVEYFDVFPTRSELAYHKYLMCGPIHLTFMRNPIITKGCPSNLKISCNIRHVHVEKAYIDPNSPLNIMTQMMYNWIMRSKLDPRENSDKGVTNFMGRIKGIHVFIGNFTYVTDFMNVEDISSIIDPRLSQVVLGKPFVEISNMTHDPPEGVVSFTNGTNRVAYKMPHKIDDDIK